MDLEDYKYYDSCNKIVKYLQAHFQDIWYFEEKKFVDIGILDYFDYMCVCVCSWGWGVVPTDFYHSYKILDFLLYMHSSRDLVYHVKKKTQ